MSDFFHKVFQPLPDKIDVDASHPALTAEVNSGLTKIGE